MKKEVDLDEMIFNYLEGNLPKEEHDQFELLIKKEPLIQMEVDLWKKTYLNDSLPESGELQEKLIRKPLKPYHLFLNSFLYLGLVFFIFPKYLNEEVTERILTNEEIYIKPDSTKASSFIELSSDDSLNIGIEKIEVITRRAKIEAERFEDDNYSEQVNLDIVDIRSQTLEPIVNQSFEGVTPSLDLEIKKVKVKKEKKYIPPSRQEIRKRNQLIRKAEEAKKAREFRKGRIPYVVPLDNKNF